MDLRFYLRIIGLGYLKGLQPDCSKSAGTHKIYEAINLALKSGNAPVTDFEQNDATMKCIASYRRKFSQGAPKWSMAKPVYGPMEVQRSELMNGIKVAAAKHLGSQISACTVMFQAGSRYENSDNLGATHFIRATASASGQGYTAYSKMRVLQQHGAYLSCSSDRQSIAFTLRCPLPIFNTLKYYLLDTAARCCYNEWDVSDRKTQVLGDLYRVHPRQHVIDLVQKALWMGPLSNSIFCEEGRVGEISETSLTSFAKANFKSNTCSIASVGVPFDDTMKLAEKIEPRRDKPPPRQTTQSCPRNGFEYCDMGRDVDTWIAVAIPGCGTCDLAYRSLRLPLGGLPARALPRNIIYNRNLLKHAIVAAACGSGNIQRGQHELDRTLQPPLGLMAGADVFTEYKAFNISYCETGVFGIVGKTRAATAKQAAFAVTEFLANVGDLDFKQIEVGKRRLKLGLTLHDEDCVKVAEGLALQLANDVQIDSAKNALCMIDSICPDEISLTAKSLSARRYQMAVAVVGDVGAVPHDQELLCMG